MRSPVAYPSPVTSQKPLFLAGILVGGAGFDTLALRTDDT